ncbi:MAG: hypothetical protein BWY78_01370 [Alphaproteobacteria bacterium ADurb.Bin438]|nr:MAG: hypothetical protein BWY78_01370 [Alphaproteobacteria bacterium ADurb.Bin438]
MKNKTLVLYNAQFILPFLEKALGEVIKNDIIDIIDSRYKNKIDHAKSYNIKLSKRASCQYDAMKECYITAEIYEKQRSV